ncbi:MAG: 7-cyano-7-deazaguanine synthase QueC [Hyphomicrobiaceae bacterium]
MTDRALVLFSGGQDSTVCLAWTLARFTHVETIGFRYGQRHVVELECRNRIRDRIMRDYPLWSKRLKDDHCLDVDVLGKIAKTTLTGNRESVSAEGGLPSTFVPGRNLLFFTLAATLAYDRGVRHLIGGMSQSDYSGYPDCRDDSIKALQVSLNTGMEAQYVLHTPLMWLNKASTWRMAETLGGQSLVELIVDETHTCYVGAREIRHAWGYGCDACPACELRSRGYETYAGSPPPQFDQDISPKPDNPI